VDTLTARYLLRRADTDPMLDSRDDSALPGSPVRHLGRLG
jgi:hypothetical protein